MPRSCNILLFFVFGYPQSMVERYCFHQIFSELRFMFLRQTSAQPLLPVSEVPVSTCVRCLSAPGSDVPRHTVIYSASSGCTKQSQTFVFDIDCCILITVMDCSAVRTCPSADLQILYSRIDASAAAACLG